MKQLLFIFALLLSTQSFAQFWGRNTESAFVNEALDVEVDANGNTYITGYITGETAFDINVVQANAAGNGDIYVAKYNQTGSLVWIEQFGGNFSDRAYDLSIDQANNILVTGQFYGTVQFGGTTLVSASNSKDIFILKLSPSGTVLWAVKEGGSGSENAYGITTDAQNSVILTGQYEGTTTIAGSTFTSIIDPNTNLPSYDLFISKYDSNGLPLWVKTGTAEYEDRGLAVHTDANNNIFMTGQFSDTMQFAGQTINNNGYNVGFLAKLNPSGQLQWLNTLRAGFVLPYDVEVDGSNEVVVIGDFLGTLQYTDGSGINSISNPYQRKIFVLKTDNNGIYDWNQTLGSDNNVSARAVAVDNAKDIYVTGYFNCGFSQLQTTQSAIFNSVGFKDAYLWKVGNNGTSLFVKQFGGKREDIGHGVAIRGNIDPIVCGSYTEDLIIPRAIPGNYLIGANDFNFLFGGGPPNVYLHGDQSQNSFVTSGVHSLTPTYNFFENQPIDSLIGNITPDQDTIHVCDGSVLSYDANTDPFMGPAYNYLWNTGSDSIPTPAPINGLYSIFVERKDGCSSGTDSIQVYVHSPPALPTMSDNLGLAINEPGAYYYEYELCAPDSVQIWFNGLNPNHTISISGGLNTAVNDTLPHFYTQEGNYTVSVSDSFCTNTGNFDIILEYTYPPALVPYLMMENESNSAYTDSITICAGDAVFFNLLDSLENPTAIFGQLPSDTTVNYWWSSTNTYTTTCVTAFRFRMYPQNTGWYPVTFFGAIGYDNSCGLDTIHITATDSFYIEVSPLPTINSISISGNNLICPNGSTYLTLSNPPPSGLSWSGAGINWISPNSDSVQVTAAGTYSIQGFITDTLTGCSDNFYFSHTITEKEPPIISTDPLDAIICPNDSVHMWVNDVYASYNWTGPMGTNLSSTFEHWDDEQGFYYVTVVDNEGCSLTSAPVEIKEYSTPYLTTEPTNVICDDEFVDLLAIFEGNGQANWTSPIVSNSSVISTNQPGWYFCELEHCGITVYDSIQVIDGSFSTILSVTDTLLCYGDSAIISAPVGLSSYEWSSGQMGVPIIVVDASGMYSATLMNSYGCIAESDTVSITVVSGSEPPIIADVSGCAGDTIVIQNLVSNPTNWYTVDTTFISSGFELVLNGQTSSTTLLASYGAIGTCPATYDEIVVTITDSLNGFSVLGDPILCPEEASNFWVITGSSNGLSVEWFLNGVSVMSTGNTIQFPPGGLNDGDTLTAEISNACFTTSTSQVITVLSSPAIEYGSDSVYVCYDGDLSLNLPQSYPNITWWSSNGISYGQQLDLANITSTELVLVSAVDANGCLSNTDSIYVITADGGIYIDNILGTVCKGDSIDWIAVSPLDSIVWSTPQGPIYDSTFSILATGASTGMYYAYAYDSLGCQYSDSMQLSVFDNPIITIPDDTILCLNTYLYFGTLSDTNSYTWNGNTVLDSMAVGQNQWLTVVAISPQGCVAVDSVYIETIDCSASLTNVFTPNGDGINDYFVIHTVPIYPNNSLIIMNRWGNVIYDVDRYDNTFNAEGVVDGTYFYYFYPKGREHPEMVIQGHLTIMRN